MGSLRKGKGKHKREWNGAFHWWAVPFSSFSTPSISPIHFACNQMTSIIVSPSLSCSEGSRRSSPSSATSHLSARAGFSSMTYERTFSSSGSVGSN